MLEKLKDHFSKLLCVKGSNLSAELADDIPNDALCLYLSKNTRLPLYTAQGNPVSASNSSVLVSGSRADYDAIALTNLVSDQNQSFVVMDKDGSYFERTKNVLIEQGYEVSQLMLTKEFSNYDAFYYMPQDSFMTQVMCLCDYLLKSEPFIITKKGWYESAYKLLYLVFISTCANGKPYPEKIAAAHKKLNNIVLDKKHVATGINDAVQLMQYMEIDGMINNTAERKELCDFLNNLIDRKLKTAHFKHAAWRPETMKEKRTAWFIKYDESMESLAKFVLFSISANIWDLNKIEPSSETDEKEEIEEPDKTDKSHGSEINDNRSIHPPTKNTPTDDTKSTAAVAGVGYIIPECYIRCVPPDIVLLCDTLKRNKMWLLAGCESIEVYKQKWGSNNANSINSFDTFVFTNLSSIEDELSCIVSYSPSEDNADESTGVNQVFSSYRSDEVVIHNRYKAQDKKDKKLQIPQ